LGGENAIQPELIGSGRSLGCQPHHGVETHAGLLCQHAGRPDHPLQVGRGHRCQAALGHRIESFEQLSHRGVRATHVAEDIAHRRDGAGHVPHPACDGVGVELAEQGLEPTRLGLLNVADRPLGDVLGLSDAADLLVHIQAGDGAAGATGLGEVAEGLELPRIPPLDSLGGLLREGPLPGQRLDLARQCQAGDAIGLTPLAIVSLDHPLEAGRVEALEGLHPAAGGLVEAGHPRHLLLWREGGHALGLGLLAGTLADHPVQLVGRHGRADRLDDLGQELRITRNHRRLLRRGAGAGDLLGDRRLGRLEGLHDLRVGAGAAEKFDELLALVHCGDVAVSPGHRRLSLCAQPREFLRLLLHQATDEPFTPFAAADNPAELLGRGLTGDRLSDHPPGRQILEEGPRLPHRHAAPAG
jgi:hypothetical protein